MKLSTWLTICGAAWLLSGCGGDYSPPWENKKESPDNTNQSSGGTTTQPSGGGDYRPAPTQPPTPNTGGGTTPPPVYNGSSLAGLFPSGLLDSSGNPISPAQLNGKHVGLFFSAHWCPQCHDFTQALTSFRNQNARDFEVVFVSLCNSEAEKASYIEEMNMAWPTTPGARTEQGALLAKQFNVQAIPQVVVLGPNGTMITPNGRQDIESNPRGALSKWRR